MGINRRSFLQSISSAFGALALSPVACGDTPLLSENRAVKTNDKRSNKPSTKSLDMTKDNRSEIREGDDFPVNPIVKPGYRLDFNDEFTADSLDHNKWFPYMLPHWTSRENAAARYAIEDGTLRLMIEEDQPSWKPGHGGEFRASNLQTASFSGAKGSSVGQFPLWPGLTVEQEQENRRLCTPQYGYIETRLKAEATQGYHVALWLIGYGENTYEKGEIVVCEIFGGHDVGQEKSHIRYGIHPWGDPELSDELYEQRIEINAANYHIYAVDWTPDYVDFYIDNKKLRRVMQSPQYPLQFMLGIYERPFELSPVTPNPHWPKVCEVDYIRTYKRIEGGV